MPTLGVHTSIAGGFHKAVERAHALGCDTVQLFTSSPRSWQTALPVRLLAKNSTQWRAKEISGDEAALFGKALKDLRIVQPVAHACYLINLASPDAVLWKKSIEAMVVELRRAKQLGIAYVVVHPGSYCESTERRGLRRCIQAINEIHRQIGSDGAQCLLESTAGQGTSLGWRFEQLASLLDGVRHTDRVGICLDTCHLFAAGYPLSTKREYEQTVTQLHNTVGLEQVKAIHLNDSKRPLGSRVDRHEHIGHGYLGRAAFRLLLRDRRFRHVPMYLETPKGQHEGRDWDLINLQTLKSLLRKPAQKRIEAPAPTK